MNQTQELNNWTRLYSDAVGWRFSSPITDAMSTVLIITDTECQKLVHGKPKLIQFALEKELIIMNTTFKHPFYRLQLERLNLENIKIT